MDKLKLIKIIDSLLNNKDNTCENNGYMDIDILIMNIIKKEHSYDKLLTKNVIIQIVNEHSEHYKIKNNLIKII